MLNREPVMLMPRQQICVTNSEAAALAWIVNMGILLTTKDFEHAPTPARDTLNEFQIALIAYAARRVPGNPTELPDFLELTPKAVANLADILPLVAEPPTDTAANAAWITSSAIALMELRTLPLPNHVIDVINENPEATSTRILTNITIQWWSQAMTSILLADVLT